MHSQCVFYQLCQRYIRMTEDKLITVPMVPDHLKSLIVHEYLGEIQSFLHNEKYAELLTAEESYSFLFNGKTIGCVGVTQVGMRRWHGWALLSRDSGPHMIAITRLANKQLSKTRKPRIETAIRSDFVNGLRWAKMLNFKCETPEPMKNYGDDGYDYYLYARCA